MHLWFFYPCILTHLLCLYVDWILIGIWCNWQMGTVNDKIRPPKMRWLESGPGLGTAWANSPPTQRGDRGEAWSKEKGDAGVGGKQWQGRSSRFLRAPQGEGNWTRSPLWTVLQVQGNSAGMGWEEPEDHWPQWVREGDSGRHRPLTPSNPVPLGGPQLGGNALTQGGVPDRLHGPGQSRETQECCETLAPWTGLLAVGTVRNGWIQAAIGHLD